MPHQVVRHAIIWNRSTVRQDDGCQDQGGDGHNDRHEGEPEPDARRLLRVLLHRQRCRRSAQRRDHEAEHQGIDDTQGAYRRQEGVLGDLVVSE